MRKTILWTMGLSLLTVTMAHAVSYRSAADVAQQFCNFMDSKNSDVFAPRFRALATADLWASIQKAERGNAVIAQAYPDMKPPLGDGIPYASFPDYAPHCVVSALNYQRRNGMAIISYSFPETPGASWSDRLYLKNQNGVWSIDDITYGRNATRMTLRQALKNVAY